MHMSVPYWHNPACHQSPAHKISSKTVNIQHGGWALGTLRHQDTSALNYSAEVSGQFSTGTELSYGTVCFCMLHGSVSCTLTWRQIPIIRVYNTRCLLYNDRLCEDSWVIGKNKELQKPTCHCHAYKLRSYRYDGHFGTGAEVSWCRSVCTPQTPQSLSSLQMMASFLPILPASPVKICLRHNTFWYCTQHQTTFI